MDPEKPPQKDALTAFREEVQELIDKEAAKGKSVSMQGIDVRELARQDVQFYGILKEGGMDRKHLQQWENSIPKDAKSRLQFLNYCKQILTKQELSRG